MASGLHLEHSSNGRLPLLVNAALHCNGKGGGGGLEMAPLHFMAATSLAAVAVAAATG